MARLFESASQTAGPYVHIGLAPGAAGFRLFDRELGQDIIAPDTDGERIRIAGRVTDGAGAVVPDVLLEFWQADGQGIYPHPADPRAAQVSRGFRGFARVICDFETGEWAFDTIRPGAVDGQAPHLSVWIVARGINIGLATRVYFPEDGVLHPTDAVLSQIPAARWPTLIAVPTGPGAYRFDIRLQGADETVFLDI
jgi:protocatechuate 3,4-dioxygenase, alpha subunit